MAQLGSNSRNKGKKNKVDCMGCGQEIDKDHTGIKCINGCNICPGECSKNFVGVVFETPAKHIPLKCMICTQQVIVQTFERQLTPQQSQIFLLYHMQFDPQFLDQNEIIASCPFCEYWEINTINEGRLMFLCQGKECKKSSCFWCKLEIKNKANVADEKVDIDESSFEQHFECGALAKYRKIWDNALSEGNTKSCPKCGVSGMKNNACTHMTCVKCQCQWCYVCGLSLTEQDKSDEYDDDNVFAHNVDWKTNEKRCPMWLNNIREVDNRWPEDSDDCVTFLHRIRTMTLLKAAVKEIGDKNYEALCKKYNIHKTCGFDMDEVMGGHHMLIKR